MNAKGGKDMKCTIMIDKNREEEIIIYAHKRNRLIDEIEQLTATDWIGYDGDITARLNLSAIDCFCVESNRVYAVTDQKKWLVKQRLYQIEEQLPDHFVRINQSCLANIRHIERFETSLGASLAVIFESGYRDYVSRRQLRSVKERLGIK